MAQHTQSSCSDRGAVLVHVAIVLLGLMAMSVFIIDRGMLYAARRQAQNAADSGALAGAVHMLYDTNMVPNGDVLTTANEVAVTNLVWNAAPVVNSSFECPAYVAVGGTVDCIRVDVYRDQAHSNPLPMIFGAFLGRNRQDIRATATARVNTGNSTDCLKPFAVPDYYTDLSTYTPLGYTVATHEGTEVVLKNDPHNQYDAGWFQLIDYSYPAGGATEVVETIMSCQGGTQGVGQEIHEEMGNLGTNISKAINDLYDLDPGATYVSGTGVTNSCADTGSCQKWVPKVKGGGFTLAPDPSRKISPRVLIVPVFDPAEFEATGRIVIVNLLGFFIKEKMAGPPEFTLTGILVTQPGLFTGGLGTVPNANSFLKIIQLIR